MRPCASLKLLACRHLGKQTKKLRAQIDGIRRGKGVEHVHPSRVISRRIRMVLGVFGSVFPAKKSGRWDKALRCLVKGLKAARDKDAQIAFVTQMMTDRRGERRGDRPGLRRLVLRLRQERAAVEPGVRKTLDRLDHGGVLEQMFLWAAKHKFSLQGGSADVRSPAVLEQGAGDIRQACDGLLGFRSCLDDAEAMEQHHAMRIAARKLRHMMEIYREPFGTRLNEAIKTVRRVQTLLGEIHDCDVWVAAIEGFIEEERRRTVDYYGDAEPFQRLGSGLEYLRDERRACRNDAFDQLAGLWKDLEADGFWGEMLAGLQSSDAGADSPASDGVTTRANEPVAEIVEPVASGGEETTGGVDVWDAEDSAGPGYDPGHGLASGRCVVGEASAGASAVCGCCGGNHFLPDQLRRIDSGQLLCPGCLGALRERASET